MKQVALKNCLLNCFLLTIPILVWNILLTNKLPPAFQSDIFGKGIPSFLRFGENMSRVVVFLLSSLMPLRLTSTTQKHGLILYTAGTFIYFVSWIALIYYPDSAWSQSMPGFLAPAYTPMLWLFGIGLIGNTFCFNLPFKRSYFFLASLVFLAFHLTHTVIIYLRVH